MVKRVQEGNKPWEFVSPSALTFSFHLYKLQLDLHDVVPEVFSTEPIVFKNSPKHKNIISFHIAQILKT